MTSLQEYLNRFIYINLTNETFLNQLKQISYQTIKAEDLHTERQQYQYSARQIQRLRADRFYKGFNFTRNMKDPETAFRYLGFITDHGPFYLNLGAFLPTIEMLGNQEQVKHWRDQTLSGKCVGGYAQTQIGHGSDVKSLQTEAVYDQTNQVWVMNSPKVTSAKFWVGLLGNFSTHIVLQAKAIVKGKSLGIQTFVIEIRNSKLELLPNVEAFDIGSKLGLDVIDNGCLLFTNKVVPRDAMLMKYIQVSPDGIVTGLENTSATKYAYGSMLNLRVQLTFGFAVDFNIFPPSWLYTTLKQMKVEKQSKNREFIINKLSYGLGVILSNCEVYTLYQAYMKEISNNNFKKADILLATVHIISSTFKAVAGRIGIDSLAEMITSYPVNLFHNSIVPSRFTMSIPGATFEGDNTVLLQQTSKFLMFKMDLSKDFQGIKKEFKSTDINEAITAFEYVITQQLSSIKERMDAYSEEGTPFKTIWNEKQQVTLVRVSQIWGFMTLLQLFKRTASKLDNFRSFFDKLSANFTHLLLKRVYQLQGEGFKIQWIDAWKQFSDEEYEQMSQIGQPIKTDEKPMVYAPRQNENWLRAKL